MRSREAISLRPIVGLSDAPTTAIDFGRKSASSRIGHCSLSGSGDRHYNAAAFGAVCHRPRERPGFRSPKRAVMWVLEYTSIKRRIGSFARVLRTRRREKLAVSGPVFAV